MIAVVLVLLALAAGVAAGYACGGRLRHLGTAPPVRNRLILTALGIYVAGVLGSWAWDPLLPAMSALCWLVLGFYAWLNRAHHGARLVALGLAANGLVILLNGAMPVSATAQARAGATHTASAQSPVTLIDDQTVLPWLGKVVPVAFPPRPEVVSPGDIAIAAGCITVLATGMTRHRPSVTARVRQPSPTAGPAPAGHRDDDGEGTGTMEERATMDTDVIAEVERVSPRASA